MTFRLDVHTDPTAYGDRVRPVLEREEAKNCLILGILSNLKAPIEPPTWLATVEDATTDDVVACLVRTQIAKVCVSELPASTIDIAAAAIAGLGPSAGGVVGPRLSTIALAEAIARRKGQTCVGHMEQGIFQCDELIEPTRPATGTWRHAEERDVELLADWNLAFHLECKIEATTRERAVANMRARLPTRTLTLWIDENNRPVSVANAAGPTRHGIRVNFVYTPHAERGRGYASSVVAAVTRHQLGEGGRKFCFLFTDLSNPTSNKIYRALGYRPVGEAISIDFAVE